MENYLITSEESYNHWKFFNCVGHNVLDLGCGRYGFVLPFEQYSPIYFGENGANKVIGVDGLDSEIEFYQNSVSNEKYKFITFLVNSGDVIKKFINDYNITAIKCDIEGDERYFSNLSTEDMNSIKEMAVEYHSFSMKNMMINKLNEWGFTIKVDANFQDTVPEMGVLFANK